MTGNTLLASIEMLRKRHPVKIIVAVPVLPTILSPYLKTDRRTYLFDSLKTFQRCSFFENFQQVEDDEVIQMLEATYPLHKNNTTYYSKNGHHEN
jgi:predicted phosphoribosyltransferase